MLRNVGLRKSVEQPVLDLNFAASQIGSNGAPDSRINFSRGSNAWFVDSDGLVKKSPHNLQVYSQDFDNAAWSKARVTVSANATTAPDGTLTADKIVETTDSGAHYWRDFASAVAGERFFFSVFAKAAERKYLQMWTAFGTGGNWPQVWNVFDVEAGTIIRSDPDGDSATIEDVGNGWFRCTTSITADSSGLDDIGFALWNGSGTVPTTSHSYVGDGSSGLFLWGAQLSQHSTLPVGNPYIKTTGSAVYAARLDHDPSWFMSAAQEQNLFTNSEMLNETGSTGWTPVRTVVTEDSTEDPNGNTTAEKVLEDSTASSSHFVRSPDFTTTAGKSYTASAYVKVAAGTDRLFRIAFSGVDSAFGYFYAQFDLQSGSLDFSVADDSSITDVGNGWFRLSVTKTASATADTAEVQLTFVQKGGSASYDGDGTSGFFVWGAQIEVGTSPGTYHRTTGAPYYGEGATPKGLLIEEARTNLVTDSESHTYFNNNNVTQTAGAALAPDGSNTAISMLETTDNGNHTLSQSVTVSDNAAVCFSFFVKANGRTDGAVEFYGAGGIFNVFNLSNGTISVGSPYSSGTDGFGGIEDYGNGWFRVHCGLTTVSGDTSGIIQLRTRDGSTNSYAGDASKGLLIWGFQVEQGSFPTSYIKTTGASATRNADVATMGPTTGGTELVVNGTYDTDTTGWSETHSMSSVSSGQLVIDHQESGNAFFHQNISVVSGRRYRLTYNMLSETGSVFHRIGDGSTHTNDSVFGFEGINVGAQQIDFTAPSTSLINFTLGFTSGSGGTFDNVSVRELYPFEAYNPSEGTLYSLSSCIGNDTHTVLAMHADSFDNYFSHTYRFGNSLRNFSRGGGSTELQTSEAVTLSNRNEIATTYDGTSMDTSVNGSDETTGTLGADIVGIHEIAFGLRYTANQYSGHIERVQYFPRALQKVTLQSLTSD